MRRTVLAIALLFIVLLAYLTVVNFVRHGVTVVGILAILIVVLFAIGIVGALRHPPEE
jgi:lipopolysaccharide export LptBFGC system permease protein LptF